MTIPKPKIILVIEGDHNTRVEIRTTLESAGHFVISTTNAGEAINLLQKMTVPSLIILSGKLPLMDGEQFVLAFRKNSSYKDVPIAQIGEPHEHRIEGTCSFLKKPLEKAELLEAVLSGSLPMNNQ